MLDCLQHLVDMERWIFPVRVEAMTGIVTAILCPARPAKILPELLNQLNGGVGQAIGLE